MADLTVADLRARFPEFGPDVDDAAISALIPQAYDLSDVAEEVTLYCLAHLLAIRGEGTGGSDGGSGVVIRKQVGPLEVEYSPQVRAGKARDVFFATTTYGRRVLALESRNARAAFSVVVA